MRSKRSKGSRIGPELADIVDPSYLQAMHDTFSDRMRANGIQLATAILDEDRTPITFEFNHCAFCRRVRKTKVGVKECRLSDEGGMRLARERFEQSGESEPVFYICRLGLVDFCAPIVAGKDIVAYFLGGQFRCNSKGLKTGDEPTLEGLVNGLAKGGDGVDRGERAEFDVDEYMADLRTMFDKVGVLGQAELNKLKKGVKALSAQLNSVVRMLNEWKGVKRVDEFMERAVDARNVEELFELIVEDLPRMMEAQHCSIFTVDRGETEDRDRLVLRKTSYPGLKKEEDAAYYIRWEGLTGWVWGKGQSLRLKDVNDEAEISDYDRLKWERKYDDSDEHKGFLCVPMIGPTGEVLGVIRMPHKIRKPDRIEEEEKEFTKHDEVFLNFVANHLAWVIECQGAEDKFKRAFGELGLVDVGQQFASGLSYHQVMDSALRCSLKLFGRDGKTHFVCSHEPDDEHWRIELIEGELLSLKGGLKDWKGRVFTTEEGFTGGVIRRGESFLSSELEKLQIPGEYLAPVVSGKSAVSAPLSSGCFAWPKQVYGAISIISDKAFGFSPEDEVLLVALGRLAGAAVRNAKSLSAFRRFVLWLGELLSQYWIIAAKLVRRQKAND